MKTYKVNGHTVSKEQFVKMLKNDQKLDLDFNDDFKREIDETEFDSIEKYIDYGIEQWLYEIELGVQDFTFNSFKYEIVK
jgi:hypothetical protein